ncbi:hypothetical protein PFISCL1PPCAC_15877, partial [Pristionchus fissidentatus]
IEMSTPASNLVMYIILRRDLISALNWPVGAVATQAAHAATAALWTFKDDAATVEYMTDMDNMHKVTLGVDSEAELEAAKERLEKKNLMHRVWVEDGMKVAIALKPYPKNTAKDATRQLKLF